MVKNHIKGGDYLKIDTIFQQLIAELNAIPTNESESIGYLSDKEELIAGFHLCDQSLNYKLLTEFDLLSLSDEQREECIKHHRSPFDDMLLIFYKDEDGALAFKIINGMGSRLITELWDIWETVELN